MNKNIWEENYRKGRYNEYPHDLIVSAVARNYYKYKDRSAIKVLDLGCGGGNNTVFLAEQGFDTYCIDGAPTAIKITKKRLEMKNLSASLKIGNFDNLPYGDNFFDCVIDRQSISFGNPLQKIKNIINEIYRVLKFDGRYIGLLMNIENPNMKYGKEVDKNTYDNFSGGNLVNSGLTHFFTEDEILSFFSNFKIEGFLNHKTVNMLESKFDPMEMSEFFVIARKVKVEEI